MTPSNSSREFKPSQEFKYVGDELDLFSHAKNWKRYWTESISRFITGSVLEVGAGIGSNTGLLVEKSPKTGRWVCLEPDAGLTSALRDRLEVTHLLGRCEVATGTLSSYAPLERFDTILYIDVLEHIERDKAELELAGGRLRAGGRVIVLSPAHQFLFTPFDQAIGHFRRYSRASLTALAPVGLTLESSYYLDSMGFFLSLANRLFLRQSMPTLKQIQFWDSKAVPVSRVLDRLLLRNFGKSVIAVWRRGA